MKFLTDRLTTEYENKLKRLPLAEPYSLPHSMDLRLPLPNTYPVEVRPAGSKGVGVFATRNISRGSVVCWYDGIITSCKVTSVFVTGEFGYSHSTHNSKHIAGFQVQFREGGVAQLCNDASTNYKDDDDLAYLKHINVDVKFYSNGRGAVFVAKKRIPKGGEVLYSYGASYWKSKHSRDALTPPMSVASLFGSVAVYMINDVIDTDKRIALVKLCSLYTTGKEAIEYYTRFEIISSIEEVIGPISKYTTAISE